MENTDATLEQGLDLLADAYTLSREALVAMILILPATLLAVFVFAPLIGAVVAELDSGERGTRVADWLGWGIGVATFATFLGMAILFWLRATTLELRAARLLRPYTREQINEALRRGH